MLDLNTPWERLDTPVLSATAPRTPAWCSGRLYTPSVLREADGTYRMWFLGSIDGPRVGAFDMGHAVSDDGLTWRIVGDEPVLRTTDVPFENSTLQTQHVLADEQFGYRMWFIATTDTQRDENGTVIENTQSLCHATSEDGIHWKVHPEPIFESGRRPCVHRLEGGGFRMWMNSRPSREQPWNALYQNIYVFDSDDGLNWTRHADPAISATEDRVGCIYPWVVRDGDRYVLFHAGYDKDWRREKRSIFQIYMAWSDDGITWEVDAEHAAFPVSRDPEKFDALYTSTPCVIADGDRWLMCYSAADTDDWWTHPKTGEKFEKHGSVYMHIGVATAPRD